MLYKIHSSAESIHMSNRFLERCPRRIPARKHIPLKFHSESVSIGYTGRDDKLLPLLYLALHLSTLTAVGGIFTPGAYI